VFDLLHLDRADLRGRTLLERKAELRQFATPGGPVMYVDHVRGEGRASEYAEISGGQVGRNFPWACCLSPAR
jgi:ATP-dependent DNA ligase